MLSGENIGFSFSFLFSLFSSSLSPLTNGYIIEGNRIIKKKADYPYLLFYPFHLFPLLKSKVDKWIISITCYQYNAKRQKEHTPHKFR